MSEAQRRSREQSSSEDGGSSASNPWIINLSNLKPPQWTLLALVGLYTTSTMGHGFLFDPYLQLLLSVSLIFGSLLFATTNIAGPLRYAWYGYHELLDKAFHFASPLGTTVLGWAPLPFLVIAALPWFRTGFFTGIMPIAWQFVREEHSQYANTVANELEDLCSEAKVNAEKALQDAHVARQHERDLRQNLKDSAEYDESSVAWKARLEFEKLALDSGRETPWQRKGPPSGGEVGNVQSREARTIANAVKAVADDMLSAVAAAQEAQSLLDRMQCKSAEINTLAKQGWKVDLTEEMKEGVKKMVEQDSDEMEEVEDMPGRCTKGIIQVIKMSEQIKKKRKFAEAAKEKATSYARDIYLTWLFVCEEHRRAISKTEDTVDDACAQAWVAANKARSDLGDAERHRNDLEQNLRAGDSHNSSLIGQLTALDSENARQALKQVTEVDKLLAVVSTAVQESIQAAEQTQTKAAEAKTAAREGRDQALIELKREVAGVLKIAQRRSTHAAGPGGKEQVRAQAWKAYRECQVVLEQHRRKVNEVSKEVDQFCIRAVAVSSLARAELGAVERLENTAHVLVNNVVRDARTAHEVSFADFYEDSMPAQSKLRQYDDWVEQAVQNASGLGSLFRDLQSQPFHTHERAALENMVTRTQEAHRMVSALKKESQRIRDDVEKFGNANKMAVDGRARQIKAAKGAAETVKHINDLVANAAEAARLVAEHAADVRKAAVEAKAAAALGKGVKDEIEMVEDTLKLADDQLKIVVNKRKGVQAKMVEFAKEYL